MTDQNRKNYRTSRLLNIPLGFLQLALIVINGLTEDWVKVSDPIANGMYFYILIPFSVAIAILGLILTIMKSERSFLKHSRFVFNALMVIAIVFSSVQLFDNF